MAGARPEPDANQLVVELDELAGISSVEVYYATELPLLNALAMHAHPKPDDRAGRHAALRDTLEQAFDLIDDESYSYAARALLGYSDRWRSVRDRSTDAGRAFTPTVSYDSFRRKGGRNYRENTLRSVADALVALSAVDAAPAAPSSGNRHDEVETHGRAASLSNAAAPTNDQGADSRRPWALAFAAGVLIAAVIVGLAISRAQSSPTATDPVAAIEPTVASASGSSTTSATVLPSPTPAAATPIPTSVVSAEPTEQPRLASSEILQEVDFTRQCRVQFPDLDPVVAERSTSAQGGWVCRELATGWEGLPDVNEACEDQYGPNASARYLAGWTCDIPTQFLNRPANYPRTSSCTYHVGSYDTAAIDLNRYADRFVQAFASADLPDNVCASGPMHYYDELPVGGVTQLLSIDGQPYGALLADDPSNVVLLDGGLWLSFESVRGLQIYQLELDILEDRVGYPAGPLRQSDGVFRLDLTSGGTLVSPSREGPYVWMPSIARFVWESTGGAEGCLGLPTRSPRTDLTSPPAQEFEFARVSIDRESGQVVFDPATACDL